jgi:alkylation response protein AidB-like acyl-CoA dehydrogenase
MDPAGYEQLRASIQAAIWAQLDPLESEIEATEKLPMSRLMPILNKTGALRLILPVEYGGLGLTIEQYLPILSEFAKVHGAIRVLVHVHNSFAHAMSEIGNERQRAEILPKTATGEHSLAFGLTEPDFGTGADLGTYARQEGDNYIITGRKWLITNSDIASHFIIFAKTSPKAVSAIIVPRGSSGFTIEPMPETMGCRGGEHGILTLSDVRVPVANLIGSEGQGQEHLERALEVSRLFIAASSLGVSERVLDLSIAHARKRVTFGKPIGSRQAIQRYLAEMAMDVYALRNMLTDAARKYDAGDRIPLEASLCKLFGLEAVGRVTDRALLVHGGIGYTRMTPIERLYRDARLNWLEEGPPTVLHLVAARALLDGQLDD